MKVSPLLFGTLHVLGRERSLARMRLECALWPKYLHHYHRCL